MDSVLLTRTEWKLGKPGSPSQAGRKAVSRRFLLHPLGMNVRTHQGIENRQNVSAIFHHAREDITQFRLSFRLAVPLRQNQGGHFDVSAQLFRGMAAQEEAVEKRRFALRKIEVVDDFRRNDLWQGRHREKGSLPKRFSASSSTVGFLRFLCNFLARDMSWWDNPCKRGVASGFYPP